tara:strand:+ start:235 stop:1437 length:1203 start_codon:yes stop_codon:yes gene_type:complete
MSTTSTADLESFRQRIRTFVVEQVPEALKIKARDGRLALGADDQRQFTRLLYEQGGWSCPSWPQEYGGPDWSYEQQYVFERELALGGAPRLNLFGPPMVGPALMEYGTEDQKRQHLPAILKGEALWCQGYSEPNSGSDLASLKSQARRVGDEYIVNGAKIWNSDAHFSDWSFGLFRTDSSGKKQHGITVLMVDLRSPGIEVRPIIKFDGLHELNMTVYNNVRVPVENRIGEEHQGWTVAKFILGHERFGTAEISRTRSMLNRLKEIAARQHDNDLPLIESPEFAGAIACAQIELEALDVTEQRYLFGPDGPDALGAEASLLKIRGTEIQQVVTELTMTVLAYYAQPRVPEQLEVGYNEALVGPWETGYAARTYFAYRAASIYSGTNEIQKNIIAKAVLGL